MKSIALLISSTAFVTACGEKQSDKPAAAPVSEPVAEQVVVDSNTATQVYWGDLHVHSRTSFDSFAFGNDNLTADDAFRFASGETIQGRTGVEAKLTRPLDFLLVSDHAEFMGILEGIKLQKPELLGSSLGKRWNELIAEGDIGGVINEFTTYINGRDALDAGYVPESFVSDVWAGANAAADRYNKPGEFTAFIGYEWTSMIDGRNLHRNILFRDGTDKTSQIKPFSALDSTNPEKLWAYLEEYENKTQGSVMSIPHNGNLSAGMMFDEADLAGNALDLDYAQRRARWEPIVEMTQVKGDSETHPLVSPDDAFADFENWDKTDIGMNVLKDEEKVAAFTHAYARPALKVGLKLADKLGANPYQFGMIGSTDSHTTFATADDNNYFGKFPDSEPSADRLTNKMGGTLWENRLLTSSGYVAVWADQNTRESLYDSLERREVYASAGPRITVRFFGGWNFSDNAGGADVMVAEGYKNGVPMGGELTQNGETAPTFLVSAMKDPEGANLDRIQIIKGWSDKGETFERIYDVAVSDDRAPDADGVIPVLDSTVDTDTASYDNSIGAKQLSTRWTDPEFDPSQRAFYYARVIEIPTPRWTTYDAVRFEKDLPDDVPAEIQERAYTSPIWYTP